MTLQADVLSLLPLDILYAVPALRFNVLLRLPRIVKVNMRHMTSHMPPNTYMYTMKYAFLVSTVHDQRALHYACVHIPVVAILKVHLLHCDSVRITMLGQQSSIQSSITNIIMYSVCVNMHVYNHTGAPSEDVPGQIREQDQVSKRVSSHKACLVLPVHHSRVQLHLLQCLGEGGVWSQQMGVRWQWHEVIKENDREGGEEDWREMGGEMRRTKERGGGGGEVVGGGGRKRRGEGEEGRGVMRK